ncbi:MAG: ankyrin repeat domain-containing protein, partial [Planctomycetales bacterium]
MRRTTAAFLVLGFLTSLVARPVLAEEKTSEKKAPRAHKESRFLRVVRGEKNRAVALETSIARYVSSKKSADPKPAANGRANAQAKDGRSPLHAAAAAGQTEVIRFLLAAGASPDVQTNEGLTPLHLAAQAGHKETVALLLKADEGRHDLIVDLISAVHIGDKAYYQQLNEVFATYDVVLYELVAPEGQRVPQARARAGANPIGLLQVGMGDMLDLVHQLKHVDYRKKNFVHADMSPKQVAESMEKRGESIWKMMLQSMGQNMARQSAKGNSGDVALLMAFFSKNRALALKRVMADQFEDMEAAMTAFGGPDGSTIITERNKIALKRLQEQIDGGKAKRIAIYYGGGHMVDIEQR